MQQQIEPDRTEIISLFESVLAAFPALAMNLQRNPEHVDLLMEVPSQAGLPFSVTFSLQGDELHLTAGAFWVEWFPCTDPKVATRFHDAVTGLLSSQYRILESLIKNRVVKAQLQRPDGERWRTIATWCNLNVFVPWPRRTRIAQAGRPDPDTNN